MSQLILGIPLVHGQEVVLVAMDDDVRSLLLVPQLIVSEDAGKLQDAVVAGLEATHLQINPKQLGLKGQIHFIIEYRSSHHKHISTGLFLLTYIDPLFYIQPAHSKIITVLNLNSFQTSQQPQKMVMPSRHQPTKLSITLAANQGNAPKRNMGSTAPSSVPSPANKDFIPLSIHSLLKQNWKVTAFELKDATEDHFQKTWGQIESSQAKRLELNGFGQLFSSIKENKEHHLIESLGSKRVEEQAIKEFRPQNQLESIIQPQRFNQTFKQNKTEETQYSNPIQYWFSSSTTNIFSDKYQRPALRQVYARKAQDR